MKKINLESLSNFKEQSGSILYAVLGGQQSVSYDTSGIGDTSTNNDTSTAADNSTDHDGSDSYDTSDNHD
ncbi:hypothetical protein SAMN05192574_11639 [Mucilaginibacter gossypiicola]|uniref:Uncharacterized protein n=1 Tax=Mucilaginibacter gossypiicola TaxID=551995 RepID=A0A1H8TLN7_9SPHI|nr:hypothetical protein [Mucilaginibacter gossypiicola]SEO91731.1 hypothetical protein SAMN05192574_11639 [Mucilaginibacter gossypiicola]